MSNHFRGNRFFILGGGGSGTPPAGCVHVVILTNSLPACTIGAYYEQTVAVSGTAPIVFNTLSGALPTGLSLNATTGVISGVPTEEGNFSFTLQALNTCPSADQKGFMISATLAPYTIRWGNYVWPDGPVPYPTFTADDFTVPNSTYLNGQLSTSATRNGIYAFPYADNVHQVMWMADILLTGSPQFNTGGDPWALNPSANTPIQSLTIAGVSGKVFFTAYQNADYSVTVS